ncbi:MAG: AroB-related putative sugar phosphate phospholyase (cyclizing) [Acidobacteriota bacterium]
MSETLVIQSHLGPYEVGFEDDLPPGLGDEAPPNVHFLLDDRVARLYERELQHVLAAPSVLRIEATETNKSLEAMPRYVSHLVAHAVRRSHTLVAIGGGIIQDITCFLAATMLRGLPWHFYPTTLLAQADSCIGSKSSINAGDAKNILGTFTPPSRIRISARFLDTLDERDVRSGIGEMLKVHAIDSPAAFDELARDYDALQESRPAMMRYIHRSLEIKKRIIEMDEFDRGPRNVMNYGHSFGHAIEAATSFGIPHGLAVTIGMDMANFTAMQVGRSTSAQYERMHGTLRKNYRGFENFEIPLDRFLGAIAKDKKNQDASLSLILPDAEGGVSQTLQANDGQFRAICEDYLAAQRNA